MPGRLIGTLALLLAIAACGSPVENAVSEVVEQVRLGDPLARQTYERNKELLESPEAVPLWIAALGEEQTPEVRAWAAGVLGTIGDEQALPALTEALDSPRQVREATINALSAFPQEEIERALIEGLRMGSRETQVACMAQLGRMQSVAAIPAILDVARAGEGQVAKAAIQTLEAIGDPSAAAPLAELAIDASRPEDFRRVAIQGLGYLQDEQTVQELERVTESLDEEGAEELEQLARQTLSELRSKMR